MIKVRRIAGDEGPLLRRMRMASLGESPHTFATTFAQAERLTDDQWAAVAAAHGTGDDQATFVAQVGDEAVGIVGAYLTANLVLTMVGLWASPGNRALGVGNALLEEVLRFAEAVGAVQVRSWLVEPDETARTFYEQHGFVPTGATIPWEPDPQYSQIEVVLPMVDEP
jgi:GNAT superfamily N-acetyltransferase